MTASEMVTAGFKCAPLAAAEANTPIKTAMAHPKLITIHPLLWPLVFANTTLATTPLPKAMIKAVPIISARNGGILFIYYKI
jgi:hypothetical protein